jgi:hypothetical protein
MKGIPRSGVTPPNQVNSIAAGGAGLDTDERAAGESGVRGQRGVGGGAGGALLGVAETTGGYPGAHPLPLVASRMILQLGRVCKRGDSMEGCGDTNFPTTNGNSFSHSCRPNVPHTVGLPTITARYSMASPGFSGRARRGGICRSGMGTGRPSTPASRAGSSRECGSAYSPRCSGRRTPRGDWTGRYTWLMRRTSAPTSTPPGQNKGR